MTALKDPCKSRPCQRSVAQYRGFTLIELIMVIVVLGVLAVFAAPRILNTDDFNARGLYDETTALLRFAQKTAIAQRRTVCTAFTGTSLTLTMATDAATSDCTVATALTGPRGDTPPAVNARGGATYSARPSTLNFNGLGQPVDNSGNALAASNRTITVANGPASIVVQDVTGYVQ